MLNAKRALLIAVLITALAGVYWGCSRLTGDNDENQVPVVFFVNVPLDSTVFNYAPVVHWTGHDPDGIVVAYQYHDDSTRAAVEAYRAGDAALSQYIASLPENAWISTYATSDTIYLRRTEADSVTEHVFMIRCVDNLNGVSPVKVRTYFRTNLPPNAPRLRWALDVARSDGEQGYLVDYSIPDTLFWGDTTTLTYPGIGFLWQGSDPDSRELNIIPLTFSYLLVNVSTGDTFPYAVYDDSNRVVGYGVGWSPWTDEAQVTFSASTALIPQPNFPLDGQYEFFLRVRDDGLTGSDTVAHATFTAVYARFERELLILDWNKHPAGPQDTRLGLRDDQEIIQFYQSVIPEGIALAEQFRQLFRPDMTEPIDLDTAWYADKDMANANGHVPYDLIRHFNAVLITAENPPITPPATALMRDRIKVLQDYMDVGGQVILVGRRLFQGYFNLSGAYALQPSAQNISDTYFSRYHHLSTIGGKSPYAPTDPAPDFEGVNTTEALLPNLRVDTTIAMALNWRNNHFPCLPDVDYFGRTTTQSGYDYSATLYTYSSATVNQSYNVYNEDCEVISSTPSRAYLVPRDTSHSRVLDVTRVYNVTRAVYGQFEYLDRAPSGRPIIVVSTPADAGAWNDTLDVLEVDYLYIPVSTSHNQPVANVYARIQGQVEIDFNTGRYLFTGVMRFRSILFTFPLSFMNNDPIPIPFIGGEATAGSQVIAWCMIAANEPRTLYYGGGG